jgi:multidrug efflux pump subunit AcrB
MALMSDDELIRTHHNLSRFFVEQRQIAWVALIAVIIWGVYGYKHMPQRKDPEISVRVAVAACTWPGASAQQVEQLITRPIEDTIAQNKTIHPPSASDYGIRSLSLPGASFVYVQLSESASNTREQFSDINLRLAAAATRLPQGASGIQFQSDFGDTAALMLTVASPLADDIEISLRAGTIANTIRATRATARPPQNRRVSIVYTYPLGLSGAVISKVSLIFARRAIEDHFFSDLRFVQGSGFSGVDGITEASDDEIRARIQNFVRTSIQASDIDPDIWPPIIIHDPSETAAKLKTVAGPKYSYAQLDNYTDLLSRSFLGAPEVSRVERKGVLQQQIYLDYSQERLAAYGLQPSNLGNLLSARNITRSAGSIQTPDQNLILNASGEFGDAASIGNVLVATTNAGGPVYLRDLVLISRSYQAPPQYLNTYSWEGPDHVWHRSRAVTLAVYMRSGEQIQRFGTSVTQAIDSVRPSLPADLIVARTSDQPLQVKENIDLFMDALYEAIILVVVIALIGFWEWRSALLMAISIPITLAMTFGMAFMVRIDLQQVSIATLIIALGLLVDDPVVANDAIKRELAAGYPPLHASWLGPTKLSRAIMFATATNIIAYLPFLMVTGNTGEFLFSLPIVMTAALVSSRLASMTFIPFLAYYLLRPSKKPTPTIAEQRTLGFYGWYYRVSGWAIEHRKLVFLFSLIFLVAGFTIALTLRTQFFPEDVQYWSYVDIWMPNNTPLTLTQSTAQRAEAVTRRVITDYQAAHPLKDNEQLLKSIATFIGGGGPRFWFSVSPEQQQQNYAQLLIQVRDKEATPALAGPLQKALEAEIPGANLIVHQLQINPVEFPIDLQISGISDLDPSREISDIRTLRQLATQAEAILRPLPGISIVQNDWFPESPEVNLQINSDKANLAGVTNMDVANSTATATDGSTVAVLREGNKQIPVVARLQTTELGQISDIRNLYVYGSQSNTKVPLTAVADLDTALITERIRRQEHFRMISVHAYPAAGVLPSQILKEAGPAIKRLQDSLPPGYRLQIGGEKAKQTSGFTNLAIVLMISIAGIYIALLLQFRNAIKPFLVFAATPYGIVGALIALAVTKTPFGFMAFLGVASLIGVIISHVIVLFDFIEEMHELGEPLEQALRDAGIARLRPVLITVAATVLALFPLALHGGPLWQPLCYAQIGGLAVATLITLILVPVLYTLAVLDLKIIRWEEIPKSPPESATTEPTTH